MDARMAAAEGSLVRRKGAAERKTDAESRERQKKQKKTRKEG